MIDNLSAVIHVFSMCMFTSFSQDEMLLLKFVNGSIDFRGLVGKVEVTSSSLKYGNCLICSYVKNNDSCCLLQPMLHGFGLSKC